MNFEIGKLCLLFYYIMLQMHFLFSVMVPSVIHLLQLINFENHELFILWLLTYFQKFKKLKEQLCRNIKLYNQFSTCG